MGIDGGGCLVQNHDGRIRHRRPGNGNQLPLALRKVRAVARQHGVIAVRQTGNEVVRVGKLCRPDAFLIRGVQLSVPDVIHNRSRKEVCFLQNHTKRTAEIRLADFVNIDVIVADLAVSDVIEPIDKVRNGGFSRTGCANKGNLLARAGIEGHIIQHLLFGHIAKVHMLHGNVALQLPIGNGAVCLVGMLPCPVAGTLRALRNGSVLGDPGIHKVHIPLVLLRLLIHHLEDSLCASQCHDNGVQLVGNLGNGHVEGAGKHHKGHQLAQRQEPAVRKDHRQAAHDCQNRILNIAQIIIDGAHHVRILAGIEGVAAEGLIQLVKFLLADFLPAEDLHDPLPGDHFFHITVHAAQRLLLAYEELSGLLHQRLGDEHYGRHRKEHDDGQEPGGLQQAHEHHKQHHPGGKGLGDGLGDHLTESINIAGIAGHDVACRIGIKVAQRQPLHLCEHFVPDGFLGALPHRCHQVAGEKRTQHTRKENAGNARQKPEYRRKVLRAGAYHGQNVVIYQIAQCLTARRLGDGGQKNADKHDYEGCRILFHIGQQPEHGLFRILCHSSVAAHSYWGHFSSPPFC